MYKTKIRNFSRFKKFTRVYKHNNHGTMKNICEIRIIKQQNHDGLLKKLKKYIEGFIVLENDEWLEFSKYIYQTTLNKKELFIKPADEHKKLGFIINGLLRSYFISEKGIEHTVNFYTDNNFIVCGKLSSSIHEKYYVEVVEDAKILAINEQDFCRLMEKNKNWKIFITGIIDDQYSQSITRIENLLALSAEQRYQCFNNDFNHIIHKIPQYQIASYLGVTPVALSRIIKRLKKI